MAKDILQHDHGGIDDDAKINRSNRQQIGGFPSHHRDDDGQEQRNRNGRRNDDGAAQIAQEQPLDEKDQRNAEQHVVQHGIHRDRHQVAAVIERLDRDPWRQAPIRVETPDGGAHPHYHFHGALEFLHQYDAVDDVGRLIAARDTQSRHEPDLYLGNIGEQHWNAILLREHNVAHVLKAAHIAKAANIDRLLADTQRPPSHIGIAGRDGVYNLRQGQAEGHHAVEVDLGLVFFRLAAEREHIRDARHDTQLALDHPVLQRLEFDQVHARWTLQLVAIDLAYRTGRRDHRLHAVGQHYAGQPIDRLLADEIVVLAVFELHPNKTEREYGIRADEF